jgi:uncharacterized protein YkwD
VTRTVMTALAVLACAACGTGTIDDGARASADAATGSSDARTEVDASTGISDARPAEADARPGEADAGPSPADARPGEADARPNPADARPSPADAREPDGAPDCRGTWPAEWAAFEAEVVRLVNEHRAAGATCGGQPRPPVGPLIANDDLREAARCHSLDMGVQGYFSHNSLDGSSPWDRIARAGYTGSPTAENISAGNRTAADAVRGWMASTGHCNNIMASGSKEIGVGYADVDGSPYGHYWTQTFGTR